MKGERWRSVWNDKTKRRTTVALGWFMVLTFFGSCLSSLLAPGTTGPLVVLEIVLFSAVLSLFGWVGFSLLAFGIIELNRESRRRRQVSSGEELGRPGDTTAPSDEQDVKSRIPDSAPEI
jgi:hypothetical protein